MSFVTEELGDDDEDVEDRVDEVDEGDRARPKPVRDRTAIIVVRNILEVYDERYLESDCSTNVSRLSGCS